MGGRENASYVSMGEVICLFGEGRQAGRGVGEADELEPLKVGRPSAEVEASPPGWSLNSATCCMYNLR